MSDSNWRIEHHCPQCGAPVLLDEADRLLSCPFCRTKLHLVTPDHFRYHIPAPDRPSSERVYLPYWRLRGTSFEIGAEGDITPRFVDASVLAAPVPGLPRTLGVRPQAMKVKFVSPDMPGTFLDAGLRDAAIPAMDFPGPDRSPAHRVFIGETVSLVYTPADLRKDTLFDALLARPMAAWTDRIAPGTTAAAKPPNWQIRFIATLCPRCGWDLEGEKDARVMICRNCDSAWSCVGTAFESVPFSVMKAPVGEPVLYLPFWRMKPRAEGVRLSSCADLIRLANLPRALSRDLEEAPVHFWSPAFKVNPALFLSWARRMTAFQPGGETGEVFAGAELHRVTLEGREAMESMTVTLASMAVDKRELCRKIPGIRLSTEETRLVYHPFIVTPRELIHPDMGVAIDRTALDLGSHL